jgi:heme A synthase
MAHHLLLGAVVLMTLRLVFFGWKDASAETATRKLAPASAVTVGMAPEKAPAPKADKLRKSRTKS